MTEIEEQRTAVVIHKILHLPKEEDISPFFFVQGIVDTLCFVGTDYCLFLYLLVC